TYEGLPACTGEFCAAIEDQVRPYHRTRIPSGAEADVLHHFWVEEASCAACEHVFELHPHFQLAYAKAKGVQWAFCRACHAVRELPHDQADFRCPCRTVTRIQSGPLQQGKVVCPQCGAVRPLVERGQSAACPPRWRLFAQEYVERSAQGLARRFKAADEA